LLNVTAVFMEKKFINQCHKGYTYRKYNRQTKSTTKDKSKQ